MKNIHILPTDQLSRLHYYYELNKRYALSKEPLSWGTASHLYIISDEEIKEGDWTLMFDDFGNLFLCDKPQQYLGIEKGHHLNKGLRKIILTTDQDLIKDGVQAIDDEFLEWFVKNPTCEFVYTYNDRVVGYEYDNYTIVIPYEGIDEDLLPKFSEEEPKKETLEEAAERLYPKAITDPYNPSEDLLEEERSIFIAGANYMAERMYSEEEVKDIVDKTIEKFYKHRYADKTKAEMKELWFENFKKK